MGKPTLYVSATDEEVKSGCDNPTIGLLLCKGKKDAMVEHALKDINNPSA